MKQKLLVVGAIIALFAFQSCGSGSSGTKMLDLDIRFHLDDDDVKKAEKDPHFKKYIDDITSMFTILPGPYEFTWTELENTDNGAGYELCRTKLKIKLRLNKAAIKGMKPGVLGNRKATEEDLIYRIKDIYILKAFNAEGKTYLQISEEGDDDCQYLLDPTYRQLRGANGKIGNKDNTDGLLDFYRFLTSQPGTEFVWEIDCGIHLCKEIEKIMEYTKGIYIEKWMNQESYLLFE